MPNGFTSLAITDAELIVVDNLSTIARGLRENEADLFGPVQTWLLQQRAANRSVLVVHHAGKGGGQRGTSRKEDVLDTVISLSRPPGYVASEGARFEVRFTKSRGFWGADAEPFEARFVDGAWSTSEIVADDSDAALAAWRAEGLSIRQIAEQSGLSKVGRGPAAEGRRVVSGVLALALRCQALSRGTVPSAVPVGHPLDSGTTGTLGTNGTVGTRGTVSTTPFDCGPIDFDAIEERAALAADSVPTCYLDAWAQLQCHRPLSVAGAARLHTERDDWSGEDWRAFFDETGGHRRVRWRAAPRTGRGQRLRLLPHRVAQPQFGALAARPLPSLRRGRARPRAAAAVRNRVHRPRLAAFALLVGLVRRQTGRGRRRLGGNGDRDTRRVSKRFR